MGNERRPVDARATTIMVMMCAIWGTQQVIIKLAAASMAPLLQVGVRSGISAVLVALVVLYRRDHAALARWTLRGGVLAGLLFGTEFVLVGEGLRLTTASHIAIFLYTAPIFAAFGLGLCLPEERLAPLQWCGIGLAFAGVVASFAGRGPAPAGSMAWLGDLLGIAAGAASGATTTVVRVSALSRAPASVTLLYQLVGGFVLATAAAVMMGEVRVTWTPVLAAGLLYQSVIVSFASYLAWFALLRIYLASRLGVISFMAPVFGTVFGVTVLGEQLDTAFICGAVMILGGIVLVSAQDLLRGGRRARAIPDGGCITGNGT
ncbi:DMT family transporter [Gluconacetobacter entanii]|uniref:DMT family transporter n=1 Tax=Gluconacetobacter entanii TaxID=108528 RepID=A0ABT3K4T5_9PROT|nr:DMT family transporter [Gluconacetobacter entanii]MCW4590409.1 DMT family transporter [Gluconacetobacter entanii]MCW4594359.1 DMT family transporter [Gluconacetobacter entanii]NPC88184.1 DMT family transporter [Gluconacetobacter entanii]